MGTVQFKLDAFQGPLDLLLHLISKHKLNICDIEISLLLDQYLAYMNELDEQDYESAGEFLEMAARLIYIKTVSLLPQPEEAQDLKKDLEGQIIEYSICKKAAEMLKQAYVGNNVFVRNPVPVIIDKTYSRVHEPEDIYNAYMGISAKSRNSKPLRADMFSPIVSRKIVSVTSKIIFVLKRLYKCGKCSMDGLYDNVTDKSERVATFLAILELTKSGRIFLNDDNTEILFKKREKHKKSENADVNAEQIPITSEQPQTVSEDTYVQSEDSEPEAELLEQQEYVQDDVSEQNVESEIEKVAPEICDVAERSIHHEVKFSSERVLNMPVISRVVECSAAMNQSSETIKNDGDNIKELCEQSVILPEQQNKCDEDVNCVPDVFKPNYWNMRKYYWGHSKVGCDGKNNFWRYG